MKDLRLSAARLGWVTLMLGGACTGPDIDFSSPGGAAGVGAAGASSLEGTAGSKAATGGLGAGASGGTGGGAAAPGGGTAGRPIEQADAGNAAEEAGGAAGAGGTAPIGDPSGGVDWEPWPAVEPVAADKCEVLPFLGGDETSPPERQEGETWQYDATTRVLTRTGVTVDYARLDAQGRREMICQHGDEFLCLEWTRDPAGNAKGYAFYAVHEGPLDERALDPAHPPIRAAPISGGSTGDGHLLTYDDAGLLSAGSYSYPEGGASLSFKRDPGGRCSEVVWNMKQGELVEVFNHLGDKLVSRTVTLVNAPTDVRAVINYAYAADGTLASTAVDGRLDYPDTFLPPPPPRDGIVDYVVRTAKQPDGSRWVELFDFHVDDARSNARVVRQGSPAKARRVRWYLSPGCEALSLPKHTSQACEFERPLPSLTPRAWHDPFATPIALGGMTPMPE